jgi:DNA helicase-2/ATP-dependent DNA helicase PcrA
MADAMLDDLTPEQRAAVTHPGGPLLVLAGAGAGKTRVLCHRLAWLVDGGATPGEILGLTFSSKAAEELRGRAEDLLGRSHETLRVMTFHALAMEIVRVHGVDRGLLPATSVATDDDRVVMLMERIGELPVTESDLRLGPGVLVPDWVKRIDRCRDQLVSPDAYVRWAEEAVRSAGRPGDAVRARKELEFARIYAMHDRWLDEAGLEDFGLSIVRALELLRAHPDRLAAARLGARHILVDEFQDTNHAQAELLYLLAGGSESLVVVGDDDQGIYRFRGASTKNVTDFRERYAAAAEVRLELNHRSTQAILDAAHAVVTPIPDRSPKRLRALPDAEGPFPAFWIADDVEGVARAVADEIVRLAGEGVPYEEQAVLVRSVRIEAPVVVEALERSGIPHQVRGGIGLFDRREVRTALAWCRALVDPADAQAHLRLAADPDLAVPWTQAAQAVSEAAASGAAVAGALLGVAREVGSPLLERLMNQMGPATTGGPATFVREVVDRSGLRRGAIALGGAEGAARLAGLAGLERLSADILRRHPDLDVAGLVARLTALAEVGFRGDVNPGGERAGVQVMTIHASKGLEFDAVFVLGLTQSNLPGRDRWSVDIPDQLLAEVLPRGREAHVAEARRLTYVAMTRARRHLVLCTHRFSGSGAAQRPSPFYEEAAAGVGGAASAEVGESLDRALLDEVGRRHHAFEQASLRAARAIAEEAADAETLAHEARRAADALVGARADAMRPVRRPEISASAPRAVRPGVTISPTDIERYRTCPLAFRFAKIDRVPQRPSPARAIGIAAHTAFEAHHRPGNEGGDADSLVARFARELARLGVAATPEAQQALERAREWFPKYHERTARMARPTVAVERPFTLTLGPHVVRGRIDRLDAHPGGGHQIVDYKTGRPPGDAGRNDEEIVLRLYLAGAYEAFDARPRGATLEYVLDGQMRQVSAEPGEVRFALDRARTIADGIAAGEFEPTPGGACRSCDFALICPAQDR